MHLPQSILKRSAVVALLMSAPVGALEIVANWSSVAPHGSDFLLKYITSVCVGYFLLLVLYNVFYAILDFFSLVIRRGKSTWTQLAGKLVFCAITFLVIMLSMDISHEIRRDAFKKIAMRGEPLIEAIKQYQLKNGSLPETLLDLVPDYIASIPSTGVGAYPDYKLITKDAQNQYGGNAWVLTVDVSTDDLTYDAIVYYPNQNYPSEKEVATSRRIGEWAHIVAAKSSEVN